jgi:orotate phosphoribosyltransferase
MGVDREFVRKYINDNCIARVPEGSKDLPSYKNQGSGYYLWQFYLREALFNPLVLDVIVRDFMAKYEEPLKAGIIQLCGVESASTPFLTGIAIACANRGLDVNIFSIRKEQKPYGRKNWLEGKVLKNKLAMMVDDVVSSSHKTSIHGAKILAEQKVPMANHIHTLVYKTKKPQMNKIKLQHREITVTYMFSLNDFDLYFRYPWSTT